MNQIDESKGNLYRFNRSAQFLNPQAYFSLTGRGYYKAQRSRALNYYLECVVDDRDRNRHEEELEDEDVRQKVHQIPVGLRQSRDEGVRNQVYRNQAEQDVHRWQKLVEIVGNAVADLIVEIASRKLINIR